MNTVKNLKLISEVVSAADINKLEAGAALHLRHSNIEFKVISYEDDTAIIKAVQGKHLSKNYATQKELIARTKELFSKFLPVETRINVHATAYVEHPITAIDGKWMDKQMQALHIKVKDIVEDTGLDKSNVSAWLNDKRPMSQIVKAMLYYYFHDKVTYLLRNESALKEFATSAGVTESVMIIRLKMSMANMFGLKGNAIISSEKKIG